MARDYKATARWMQATVRRNLLGTSQRRWTTYGVVTAFVLAAVFMPPLGIAVFGGAFAGWWLAVGIFTFIGALAGNRWGVHAEMKAKQPPADL